MMKRFLLIWFIALSLCGSCDFSNVVDIELPEHDPSIVVVGDLNNKESNQGLFVSSSVSYSNSEPFNSLENAVVSISDEDNGNTKILIYEDTTKLFILREANFLRSESNYKLTVESDEKTGVVSFQTLPSEIVDFSVEFSPQAGSQTTFDRQMDLLKISFNDARIKNYYFLKVRTFREGFESELSTPIKVEPILTIIESQPSFGFLFTDISFNGKRKEILIDHLIASESTDSIVVDLYNLTEDGYLFYESFKRYDDTEDNIFVEPVRVHSNIENGIGTFSLSSKSSITISL